jgi:uncharacterized protein (TIGR03437 family)
MRLFNIFFLGIVFYATLAARPLIFEQRSTDSYLTHIGNQIVIIHRDAVSIGGTTLRFAHASPASRLEPIGGSSPATYITADARRTFQQFPKLALRRVYPGVDVVFYGNGDHLEYDLVASRGVDLNRLRILFEGARNIRLDSTGALQVETGSGGFTQTVPKVFQSDGRLIAASYVLYSRNQAGFRIGPHNPKRPLTIDPELTFTKYFGGSGTDAASAIATDAQGNVYIAGTTNSVDFPTTSGIQPKPRAPLTAISGGGASFAPLPVGSETSVLSVGGTKDGNVLYAVAADAVYVSSDHGATWTQNAPLPTPVSPFGTPIPSVNNIAVDEIDPSRVFVATNTGLYFSSVGGQSWSPYTGLPSSVIGQLNASSVLLSPADRALIYVVTGQPFGVYKSANYGSTWTQLKPTYDGRTQLDSTQPYVAALSPDGGALFVVDTNGTLVRTTDGGSTWQPLAQQLYNARNLLIDPSAPSNIYVSDFAGVLKSTDGGATFTQLVPASTLVLTVTQMAIDSASGTLFIGTSNAIRTIPASGGPLTTLPLTPSNLHALTTLGNQVYAGFDVATAAYVIKWDPSGTNILYSTFFGGSAQDYVSGLAVDAQGNCTVAGYTFSTDFPVTTKLTGPAIKPGYEAGFITRLSPDGTSLLYSSLVGGNGTGGGNPNPIIYILGLALDSSGAAYVTGQTNAPDFPLSATAIQSARPQANCNRPQQGLLVGVNLAGNAFISKISPDGSQFVYSTLLTGSCGSVGSAIAVDAAGEAVVTGFTTSSDLQTTPDAYQAIFPGTPAQTLPPNTLSVGFASKLSAAGDRLLGSTYLGGSYQTRANAVAMDKQGNAYITGSSANLLPGATPGAYQTAAVDRCAFPISIGPSLPYGGTNDAYLLKLNNTLSSAAFLTYLGGGCDESGNSLALDPAGNAWIVGLSASSDFPLKSPYQGGGINGRFVSEISANGSQLLFSSATDASFVAVDPMGSVHLAGAGSTSTLGKHIQSFNGVGTAVEWNKINPANTPGVIIDNVRPVTNYPPTVLSPSVLGASIVPGELVRLTGHNLGPPTLVTGQADATGRLPFTLAGTIVLFDNIPAPLVSVEDTAITCLAPFEISPTTTVAVESGSQKSNPVRLGVTSSDLQVLSVLNQDNTPNSSDHPARPGEVVVFYVSGAGVTRPLSADGLLNTSPLPVPVTAVRVYLQGKPVAAEFVGAAPGQVAGIVQVNVRLPLGPYPSNTIGVALNSGGAPVYITQ